MCIRHQGQPKVSGLLYLSTFTPTNNKPSELKQLVLKYFMNMFYGSYLFQIKREHTASF